MKCLACDKVLSEFESTRRSLMSGEFMDLCNRCYSNIEEDAPALTRSDLGSLIDVIPSKDE
tara:strand:- start:380 stop:562 length:183 start_codon:yes stop_codon:yes gene_type:complete